MLRGVLALGFVGLAGMAEAGLTICNAADTGKQVAIAYHDGAGWVSEGWWSVAPEACRQVLDPPLTQRHYYYTLSGEADFSGQGYGFCVQSEAFTLTGAEGDCAAAGAEWRPFAHVDTGETEADFTLTLRTPGPPVIKSGIEAALTGAPVQPGPGPALSEAALTESFAPGSHGEPFTVDAVMQGCDAAGACTFYAEGARWIVQPGVSNAAALQAMAAMPVTAPVRVIGDLVFFGDITAEAEVSRIEMADPDAYAGFRLAMQGDWVSVDDPGSRLRIIGSEQQSIYDGQVLDTSVLQFSELCPEGEGGGGPVLTARVMGGDPMDALCYAVLDITPGRMDLSYVGRGNTLGYVRP